MCRCVNVDVKNERYSESIRGFGGLEETLDGRVRCALISF